MEGERKGRGRPRNGKGDVFTRERQAEGAAVRTVVILETADYEALLKLAHADERSAPAQMRWIIRQYINNRAAVDAAEMKL